MAWAAKASDTKGKEPLGQKTVGGSSGDGNRKGGLPLPQGKSWEKGGGMQGLGGENWGNQMAMEAARDPEARGGGLCRNVLSSHHLRRDVGQSWGAEVLSGLALPHQGSSSRKPPGLGLLVLAPYPRDCPRSYLQSAPLP